MSESHFQAKIISFYEKNGYFVIKLSKTNRNGIPDLVCLKPNETALFIEVKARRGVLSALQLYRHSQLTSLGFTVLVLREGAVDKESFEHLTNL